MSFRVVVTPLRERSENKPKIGELITDNNNGDISLFNSETNMESATKEIKSNLVIDKINSNIIKKNIENEIKSLGTYLNEEFNIGTDKDKNILGSLNYIAEENQKYIDENYLEKHYDIDILREKIYGINNENSYSHILRQLLLESDKLDENYNDNIKILDPLELENKLSDVYDKQLDKFEKELDELEFYLDQYADRLIYSNSIKNSLEAVYNEYVDNKEILKSKKFMYYNERIFRNNDGALSYFPKNDSGDLNLQTENEIYDNTYYSPKQSLFLDSPSNSIKLLYSDTIMKDHFIMSPLSSNFDGDDNVLMLNSYFYNRTLDSNETMVTYSNRSSITTSDNKKEGYDTLNTSIGNTRMWNPSINAKTNYKSYLSADNILPFYLNDSPLSTDDSSLKLKNNGLYIEKYFNEITTYDNRYNKRIFISNNLDERMYADRLNAYNALLFKYNKNGNLFNNYSDSDNTSSLSLSRLINGNNYFENYPSTYYIKDQETLFNIDNLSSYEIAQLYLNMRQNYRNTNSIDYEFDNNISNYKYYQFQSPILLYKYTNGDNIKIIKRDNYSNLRIINSYQTLINFYLNQVEKKVYATNDDSTMVFDTYRPNYLYYKGFGLVGAEHSKSENDMDYKHELDFNIFKMNESLVRHLSLMISSLEYMLPKNTYTPDFNTYFMSCEKEVDDASEYEESDIASKDNLYSLDNVNIEEGTGSFNVVALNYTVFYNKSTNIKSFKYVNNKTNNITENLTFTQNPNTFTTEHIYSINTNNKFKYFKFKYIEKTWNDYIREYLIPKTIKDNLINEKTINDYELIFNKKIDITNDLFNRDLNKYINRQGGNLII